ncbi:mevalonate kinase family protein [Cryobacterium psychrophilum]|uniref:Uncharacterized protein n=1 Tax=Cryobacterium psychrophilum TaxID=41988 RepID=A0A4Y8KIZ0_9MICO|nr:hypothetical protein [Cryobacterium psychrophilum]TDW28409.1 phosphomevalonate kinase [Cryobacterium psychrophilum]TFD75092.1 hypothetical protein E3T53_16605 [Cryobacterium psychrophilum]
MPTFHASAPGKLFLLGEYAVLEGAPALLTAVDRRVRVRIATTDADRWLLDAPGLGVESLTLEPDGAVPASLDGPTREKLRLYDAVRRTVAEAAGGDDGSRRPCRARPDQALSITIDSSELSMDGHKLGLGGSAAVAVALTASLARARARDLDNAALFAAALTAHRQAQGALGSGGDVAAAVAGGLISYAPGTHLGPAVSVASLRWPSDLSMMVVVTGAGSSTPELVGRVADFARRDASTYRSDLARLAELAEQAVPALATADTFLPLAAQYFDALVTLDAHAQAGIISDRHRQLHALAARLGGVFKSSGAGGGDVGLAFARSGAPARRLAAALTRAEAQIVPLTVCAGGIDTSGTGTAAGFDSACTKKDSL